MRDSQEYGDDSWTLTDAERKVQTAKRERSDKISKIMGTYLLKGWRMLATTCDECDTILLQDQQGSTYCIGCSELDDDASKDDPAVSREAARAHVLENDHRQSRSLDPPGATAASLTPPTISHNYTHTGPLHCPNPPSALVQPARVLQEPSGSLQDSLNTVSQETVHRLSAKMEWASHKLQGCENVDSAVQMCALIKACAEGIKLVRDLHSEPHCF